MGGRIPKPAAENAVLGSTVTVFIPGPGFRIPDFCEKIITTYS